jgi:hypothetical protein
VKTYGITNEINQEATLNELETYLKKTLTPVEPRPIFVSYLRTRLGRIKIVRRTISKGMKFLLITLAGIASGAIVIITSARLILLIIGALGLIREIKFRAEQKSDPQLLA